MSASVGVSPSSVAPGGATTISGTGFGSRESVAVTLDGGAIRSICSSSGGAFSFSYTTPGGITPGSHTVAASSLAGSASTTLTVTGTPPGIPPIPPGGGSTFLKNFADGLLSPFRILTYPNSHPGDLTIQYGRFVSDSAHISVHDGYLDLKCTRNADGSWSQSFVGTGMDGLGGLATFDFQYGTARCMARFVGGGPGAWQASWYLIATAWTSPEIDWAELIGGALTANLHGSGHDGQKASHVRPPDSEWHEYGIVKAPGSVTFLYDGVSVGSSAVDSTMDAAHMGLLADCKVGLVRPTVATASPLELQIAWWTVDP